MPENEAPRRLWDADAQREEREKVDREKVDSAEQKTSPADIKREDYEKVADMDHRGMLTSDKRMLEGLRAEYTKREGAVREASTDPSDRSGALIAAANKEQAAAAKETTAADQDDAVANKEQGAGHYSKAAEHHENAAAHHSKAAAHHSTAAGFQARAEPFRQQARALDHQADLLQHKGALLGHEADLISSYDKVVQDENAEHIAQDLSEIKIDGNPYPDHPGE